MEPDDTALVPSNGGVSSDDGSKNANLIDGKTFQAYLSRLLTALLDAKETEVETTLWQQPTTPERLVKFISELQVPAMYILKEKVSSGMCTLT
jgi:hypothetical protein